MKIERLFFELLHVAIGNQNSLSKLPSEKEWKALYDMAQKQSLLAVCYMGLKNLGADSDEGFIRIGISEDTYFHWVGMTAIIQQKNQIVDEQCFKLHTKLAMEGMRSCVLKGQGVGQLYDAPLRGLRQSGDIDVWVDASRKDIIKYVQKVAPTTNVREHHIELDAFQETEVEIHFWPAVIRHFLKNRKLQRWFEGKREEQFNNYLKISDSSKTSELKLCVPILEFHAVQQMAHMYHHLFDSGIGLRQVMDYYYVLKALSATPEKRKTLAADIKHIGMGRFASAMMYVLHVTMGLKEEMMIISPNKKDGEFLLAEIMRGGNFGKYDKKKTRNTSNYFGSFYGSIFRNFRYLRFNPFDWFWSPLWRLYYFAWRKSNGYH